MRDETASLYEISPLTVNGLFYYDSLTSITLGLYSVIKTEQTLISSNDPSLYALLFVKRSGACNYDSHLSITRICKLIFLFNLRITDLRVMNDTGTVQLALIDIV